MSTQSDCPSSEQLIALADDRLSIGDEEKLVAHLDRCDACRQRMDTLFPADFADQVSDRLNQEDDTPASLMHAILQIQGPTKEPAQVVEPQSSKSLIWIVAVSIVVLLVIMYIAFGF